MIKLFVFLGNYGKKYENTRHNIAWIISENIALTGGLAWQGKFKGEYAKRPHPADNTEILHFLKPHTYMNLSGESVIELAKFFKLKPEEILVIHDELEIKVATISLKWSGGLGGHNGLRSIKSTLGTADFWRLRLGIGRPEFKDADIADYVLSPVPKSEIEMFREITQSLDTLVEKIVNCKTQAEIQNLLNEWKKVEYKKV